MRHIAKPQIVNDDISLKFSEPLDSRDWTLRVYDERGHSFVIGNENSKYRLKNPNTLEFLDSSGLDCFRGRIDFIFSLIQNEIVLFPLISGNYFPAIDGFKGDKRLLSSLVNYGENPRQEKERGFSDYYQAIFQNSFLCNFDRSAIFFNRTVYEKEYEYLSALNLGSDAIENLNRQGLGIFLSEPLNFFHQNFHENRLLRLIHEFTRNNRLNNVTVFTCEYNVGMLEAHFPGINFRCKDIFATIVGLFILERCDLDRSLAILRAKIRKKFWCGNISYTQHRHHTAAYMSTKAANLSWPHKQDLSEEDSLCPAYTRNMNSPGGRFLEFVKANDHGIYRALMEGNERIMSSAPFVMDGGSNSRELSILEFYDECFCAVVTETYFNTPYANFSEKTMLAMAYGKPFVLIAPPRTLEYLKKLGFQTFGEFWDESYDEEINPQRRMLKAFQTIDALDSLSLDELKGLYEKITPVLRHNIEVLKRFPKDETIL